MPLPDPEFISLDYATDILECRPEQMRFFISDGLLPAYVSTPTSFHMFPSMYGELASYCQIKPPVQFYKGEWQGEVGSEYLVLFDKNGCEVKEEAFYPGPRWVFSEDQILLRTVEIWSFKGNDGRMPKSDPNKSEEIENVVRRLRAKGLLTEKIVVRLKDESGYTWLQIGRALDLGKSGTKKEIDALKSRVRRLYKKGET